ncbi:DUF4184 family protein [Pontibacter brevis]
MTGLIIGSMAPDFEKFIRMQAYDAYSHTWRSIFYFNLPIALILAFLFHLVVRDQLIDHLPAFLQKRFIRFKNFDWKKHFRKHYVVIILSILVGTVSHIAWDAFTHRDGLFVRWFPVLLEYMSIGPVSVGIFNFLQISFSIIGLLVVLYVLFTFPEKRVQNLPGSTSRKAWFWVVFTLIAFVITVIRYVVGYHLSYLSNFVVVMISAGLLSLLITSLLFRIKKPSGNANVFCILLAFSVHLPVQGV